MCVRVCLKSITVGSKLWKHSINASYEISKTTILVCFYSMALHVSMATTMNENESNYTLPQITNRKSRETPHSMRIYSVYELALHTTADGALGVVCLNNSLYLTLSIMIKTLKQMAFVSWVIKFTCYL